MSARAIEVTVLSPGGDVLGKWMGTPTNSLWRARGQAPHLTVHGAARPCERHGEGWALRLRDGERIPKNNARTRL